MKQIIQKLKRISQLKKIFKMPYEWLKNINNYLYYHIVTKAKNRCQKKCEYNNIIIVAHPDDEIIFFNKFLLKNKDTLVICLTNGGNRVRSNEFFSSMLYYKCNGIMLNFKDGCDVYWDDKKVKSELNVYINNNQLKKIITHNNAGEYGHLQHREANRIMVSISQDYELLCTEKDEALFNNENRLNKTMLKNKIEVFKSIYKTQYLRILDKKDIYYKYILHEKLINFYFEK